MQTLKKYDQGEVVKILQDALNKHGANPKLLVDGDFGNKTETAVKEMQVRHGLPITGVCDTLTWQHLDIVEAPLGDYLKFNWIPVINWETGGEAYYNKFLKHFTYPGGQSGCTIGPGIDAAYYTATELRNIFDFLPKTDQELIVGAIGKTGQSAKNYLPKLKHIEVSWEKALNLFYKIILPKYYKLTLSTWPGVEKLKEKAQVALTSIIFNRGTSLIGDSRREMRVIKELVPKKLYHEIAVQIRSMKRLWIGQGLDGLIKRREEEAVMVES